MARTILDVSRWQGTIDWEKVKASGKISGAMLRAVDVEDELALAPLGKQTLTDLTTYELAAVESWGVYAMLYTGLYFAQNNLYMGGAALKPYDVWLAAYRTVKPTPGWPFGMWQYSRKGSLPGISGDVDLSEAYKDYTGIIRRKGLDKVKGA